MGYERKVTPENKIKALELLRQSMTTAEIASTIGIDESTIYFWIAKDSDFCNAWKPQIIANHLKSIVENTNELQALKERVQQAVDEKDASLAPIYAIQAKLINQGNLASMGVLSKALPLFYEKLETNNKTELSGGLSVSDVAKMDDGALHDTIRNLTQQG